jgi:Icc-related predicted phosphoesterase
MRLAYAADLHGNIELYRALLDLAVTSGAQAVIVGGDLLPHASRIADALHTQREFVEARLRPLLDAFHTAHPSIMVYLLPGNDDWAAAIASLDALERDGLCSGLHERMHPLSQPGPAAGWLAGYACVPPTPFSIKDYERRDQGSRRPSTFAQALWSRTGAITPVGEAEFARLPSIADDLAALAQRSDPARTIYVCHTPPADTPLDAMAGGRHVGSPALRAFIERHAPPLTLHGHIHESPEISGSYAARIGSTWSVNPGRSPTRLHGVTLDSEDIDGTLQHTIYGRPGGQTAF